MVEVRVMAIYQSYLTLIIPISLSSGKIINLSVLSMIFLRKFKKYHFNFLRFFLVPKNKRVIIFF